MSYRSFIESSSIFVVVTDYKSDAIRGSYYRSDIILVINILDVGEKERETVCSNKLGTYAYW